MLDQRQTPVLIISIIWPDIALKLTSWSKEKSGPFESGGESSKNRDSEGLPGVSQNMLNGSAVLSSSIVGLESLAT